MFAKILAKSFSSLPVRISSFVLYCTSFTYLALLLGFFAALMTSSAAVGSDDTYLISPDQAHAYSERVKTLMRHIFGNRTFFLDKGCLHHKLDEQICRYVVQKLKAGEFDVVAPDEWSENDPNLPTLVEIRDRCRGLNLREDPLMLSWGMGYVTTDLSVYHFYKRSKNHNGNLVYGFQGKHYYRVWFDYPSFYGDWMAGHFIVFEYPGCVRVDAHFFRDQEGCSPKPQRFVPRDYVAEFVQIEDLLFWINLYPECFHYVLEFVDLGLDGRLAWHDNWLSWRGYRLVTQVSADEPTVSAEAIEGESEPLALKKSKTPDLRYIDFRRKRIADFYTLVVDREPEVCEPIAASLNEERMILTVDSDHFLIPMRQALLGTKYSADWYRKKAVHVGTGHKEKIEMAVVDFDGDGGSDVLLREIRSKYRSPHDALYLRKDVDPAVLRQTLVSFEETQGEIVITAQTVTEICEIGNHPSTDFGNCDQPQRPSSPKLLIDIAQVNGSTYIVVTPAAYWSRDIYIYVLRYVSDSEIHVVCQLKSNYHIEGRWPLG